MAQPVRAHVLCEAGAARGLPDDLADLLAGERPALLPRRKWVGITLGWPRERHPQRGRSAMRAILVASGRGSHARRGARPDLTTCIRGLAPRTVTPLPQVHNRSADLDDIHLRHPIVGDDQVVGALRNNLIIKGLSTVVTSCPIRRFR